MTGDDKRRIKEALEVLVKVRCDGLVPASRATRLSTTQLHACYNRDKADMPAIDVIMDLESFSGAHDVTDEMLRILGRAAVPLVWEDGTALGAAVVQGTREAAEISAAYILAKEDDGRVDADEAVPLQRRGIALFRIASRIIHLTGAIGRAGSKANLTSSPPAAPAVMGGGASAGLGHPPGLGGGRPHQQHHRSEA